MLRRGALHGIRVLELEGLAAAPFCGMILSDFGADVIRVDRHDQKNPHIATTAFGRGKKSIKLNLKSVEGRAAFAELADSSDVLLEGYRPGVMERLGIGPDALCESNKSLIYARLTGWGQHGAFAAMAGHDINYIASSGALAAFARPGERPLPPVNLLGDFAGGSLMCTIGILTAVIERGNSGLGQVIDASMLDGATYLTSFLHAMHGSGFWVHEAGVNLLDTGAPFYDTYRCKDGKFMAVGALEPQFFALMCRLLELEAESCMAPSTQMNRKGWPEMRALLETTFASKTRDEWAEVFHGTDACVTPVFGMDETMAHSHAQDRNLLWERPKHGGNDTKPFSLEPVAAPRLSRTPASHPSALENPSSGEHTEEILSALGLPAERIARILAEGNSDHGQRNMPF